jgi:hypothetical protein
VIIGAQVPPLTGGKWLSAVSIPLMGGWIAATTTDKTDMFGGPFPVFLYLLVVGLAALSWGVITDPGSPPKGGRFRFAAVVLEEIALGVASFVVFWAVVGS